MRGGGSGCVVVVVLLLLLLLLSFLYQVIDSSIPFTVLAFQAGTQHCDSSRGGSQWRKGFAILDEISRYAHVKNDD